MIVYGQKCHVKKWKADLIVKLLTFEPLSMFCKLK